mgnify:FL=1
MSFHEKSSWIMFSLISITGLLYLAEVFSLTHNEKLPPPDAPSLVLYLAAMAVLSIIGHIVIAALAPKDANARLDEREVVIFARAGSIAGHVFSVGVVLSMFLYLLEPNGDILFYCVAATLVISELADCAVKIYLYRIGVL